PVAKSRPLDASILHDTPYDMTHDTLNERAYRLAQEEGARYGRFQEIPGGGRVLDLGVEHPGNLGAGLLLARLTLGDLAEVRIEPGAAVFSGESRATSSAAERSAPSTLAP